MYRAPGWNHILLDFCHSRGEEIQCRHAWYLHMNVQAKMKNVNYTNPKF